VTGSEPAEKVARDLTQAGYTGLFLSGDQSSAAAVWRGGGNRAALEEIVRDERADSLARVLASEVLYANDPMYPPAEWRETLGPIYARALALTGAESGPIQVPANLWGFMYRGDELGVGDSGALAAHLLKAGSPAIPQLIELLDDAERILYEGSQEATLGNSLRYRVKDAAAYFLGKLAGIPVPLHDDPGDRDEEIRRLREALAERG
jgi:hypothetical protein